MNAIKSAEKSKNAMKKGNEFLDLINTNSDRTVIAQDTKTRIKKKEINPIIISRKLHKQHRGYESLNECSNKQQW